MRALLCGVAAIWAAAGAAHGEIVLSISNSDRNISLSGSSVASDQFTVDFTNPTMQWAGAGEFFSEPTTMDFRGSITDVTTGYSRGIRWLSFLDGGAFQITLFPDPINTARPFIASAGDLIVADGGFHESFPRPEISFSGMGLPYASGQISGRNLAATVLVSAIPADFNLDNFVNSGDLTSWKVDYGFGDTFDGADFVMWQHELGNSVSALGSVPEPASAVLACVLLLGLRHASSRRSTFRLCRAASN